MTHYGFVALTDGWLAWGPDTEHKCGKRACDVEDGRDYLDLPPSYIAVLDVKEYLQGAACLRCDFRDEFRCLSCGLQIDEWLTMLPHIPIGDAGDCTPAWCKYSVTQTRNDR